MRTIIVLMKTIPARAFLIALFLIVLLGCNTQQQPAVSSLSPFIKLPDGMPAGWRSDGSQLMLAFTRQGTSVISLEGTTVSTVESPLNYSQDRTFCPTWSPNGTAFLYQERLTETTSSKLHLVNLSGIDTIFPHEIFNWSCPAWLPDGRHFSIEIHKTVLIFDLDGQLRRTLALDSTDIDHATWSPDGEYIAFSSWDSRKVILASSITGTIIRNNGFPRQGMYPTWSPNSQYVAYIETKGSPGIGDLVVAKIDGTEVITIAGPTLSDEYYYTEPMWSPRGDYIAISRIHRNNIHDYTVAPREAGLIPVPDELKNSATK